MSEDSAEQPEAKLPTCNICKKSFPHKHSLRQHRQQTGHASADTDGAESDSGDEVSKSFKCTICNRSFRFKHWLQKHKKSKHTSKVPGASVKPAEDAKPSPKVQSPAVDSEAPIKQEHLKQEDQDQDSEPTVLSCPLCDGLFNLQSGLDQHKKAKHDPKLETDKINCKWCNRRTFVDDRALQDHHRDAHNQVCTHCRKVFRTKAALEQHKRALRQWHPEETTEPTENPIGNSKNQKEKATEPSRQPYKCDFCNSSFHHFDLLEQHVIRHNLWSDDGPITAYKCDFCPKTFYSYDEVEHHMRTTYRFPSPNPWDYTDEQTDEEDYEEGYEESNEDSDGEDDYDESNDEEAEESDEENNEESDTENEEENDEESDREPVAEPIEKPGENCTEKLDAELPPPPFKCSDCDEAFYFTATLQEHQYMFAHGPMATRENEPEPVTGPPATRFNCRDCDEAFHFAAMLLEHEKKVGHGPFTLSKKEPVEKPADESIAGPPPPRFKCQVCGEAFYFAVVLNEHERKVGHVSPATSKKPVETTAAGPPPPKIKCEHCDEAFYYVAMLLEHQEKLSHGTWAAEKNKPIEKPTTEDNAKNASVLVFKCTACGRLYRNVNRFLGHMDHNHGRHPTNPHRCLTKVAPEEADAPFTKITSGFRCNPCNEPFRNQHLLANHWEERHENAWLALFDQGNISDESLSYSDFQKFDDYDEDDMLDDLREINSWSSEKNTIHCVTCWKMFRTSSQMVEHVEMRECHSYIDARSIKWAIDASDQSVVSRCYSDNKFQCPGCEARFDSLSSLIRHAEGNKCNSDVSQGPLKAFMTEVRWRMIEAELF
ncbi:metalloregulatory (zinc-responsiveness transcriptional activator) [Fusarium agapanthi]|uniref:Metalloregulatory (Zinc-responsiveness transcriptional activator) n=1 Tax=Fusarium agapanthi TaxID=1803897 RepID=A0A9P5BC49_9HYPO|nr:metalloregulatory (zinc-responsiveness transcriptional activator) [Fusarium agapanthi]